MFTVLLCCVEFPRLSIALTVNVKLLIELIVPKSILTSAELLHAPVLVTPFTVAEYDTIDAPFIDVALLAIGIVTLNVELFCMIYWLLPVSPVVVEFVSKYVTPLAVNVGLLLVTLAVILVTSCDVLVPSEPSSV